MATRTIKFTQWLKLLAKHTIAGEFDGPADNLIGVPVADVAEKLGVSRQRVYQMIEQDVLDVVQVTTSAGRVAVSLVTEASLNRYLAERTPDRNRQGYFSFQV